LHHGADRRSYQHSKLARPDALPLAPWQFAANGKNKGLGCRNVFKISIVLIPCPMDLRLALVALPILLALGWAGFNIGRAALGQLQLMIKRAGG
jgi:photosystem II PsbY protein